MHVRRCLMHVPAKAVLFYAYLSTFISSKVIVYPDQIARLMSPKDEDIRAAREDFNYNPISFQEGLKTILSL